jgi:hypothetical protein
MQVSNTASSYYCNRPIIIWFCRSFFAVCIDNNYLSCLSTEIFVSCLTSILPSNSSSYRYLKPQRIDRNQVYLLAHHQCHNACLIKSLLWYWAFDIYFRNHRLNPLYQTLHTLNRFLLLSSFFIGFFGCNFLLFNYIRFDR